MPQTTRGSATRLKGASGDADICSVSAVLRRGGGALAGVLVVLVVLAAPAWAGPASAGRGCSVTSGAVTLVGTDTTGATTEVALDVEESKILPTAGAPAGLSPPRAGKAYLAVTLLPQQDFAFQIPASAATLQTKGARIAPALTPDPFGASWYFSVPVAMTTATLALGPATVTSEASGDSYSTAPLAISFQCQAAAPSGPRPAGGSRNGGGTAFLLGVALGALVVAGGAVGALRWQKRRSFARAHAQGRVRFLAAPLVTAPGEPAEARSIVVKILGWLDITGIDKPTARVPGPVTELAVYLVLNRGRSFTSLELADEIWCLGRKPVTVHTIRTYVHSFRRTFGKGVLVTEGFTYALTDAVGCDYDDYRLGVADSEQPAGALRALGLVRGRVLQGSFGKGKNVPFAWAEDTASRIDVDIARLAQQTATELFTAGDQRDADAACAAGLRAQPTNVALRQLDLEVGLALGGQSELARRLLAGQTALAEFPRDLVQLEARAGELGFEGVTRR